MKFDCSLVLQISQHTEAERERERGGGREGERDREGERKRFRVPSDDEVPDGFDTTSGKQNGVIRRSDVFPDFQVVITRK